MKDGSQAGSENGLETGRREFARWRGGRRRGARIPERLWALAVRLAREHGVSKTALRLGLDYYALKKHLQAVARLEAEARRVEPGFVELPLMAQPGVAGSVLELVDGRGCRLRIELRDGAATDMDAVARSLWEARA